MFLTYIHSIYTINFRLIENTGNHANITLYFIFISFFQSIFSVILITDHCTTPTNTKKKRKEKSPPQIHSGPTQKNDIQNKLGRKTVRLFTKFTDVSHFLHFSKRLHPGDLNIVNLIGAGWHKINKFINKKDNTTQINSWQDDHFKMPDSQNALLISSRQQLQATFGLYATREIHDCFFIHFQYLNKIK